MNHLFIANIRAFLWYLRSMGTNNESRHARTIIYPKNLSERNNKLEIIREFHDE